MGANQTGWAKFAVLERLVTSPVTRLWLGLAFILSLLLTAGVGVVNLRLMGEMKTEIQRLTDIRWQSSQFAHQALELSSRNSQITLQVFQVTDSKQIDALMAERQENSDQISALLTQVAGMVNSDASVAPLPGDLGEVCDLSK